jgi:hypothetical protein
VAPGDGGSGGAGGPAGLDQTRTNMDTCGTTAGYLVIFNRDPDVPWKDKIFHRTEICRGIPVQIWGM